MILALPSPQTIETSAFTFAGTLILGIVWALVNANIRHWAGAKGHDIYLLKLWDLLPEWGRKLLAGWRPLRQLWWLWLSLGLSGGLGIALLLLSPPSPSVSTMAYVHSQLNESNKNIASLQEKRTIAEQAQNYAKTQLNTKIDLLSNKQKNLIISLGEIFGEVRVQSELSAANSKAPSQLSVTNCYIPLCKIIVSSTKENQTFAKLVETIAQSQQCDARDAPSPPPPPHPTDADKPPPKPIIIPDPLPYIVVRYPKPEDVQNLPEPPNDQIGFNPYHPVPSQEINENTAKFRDQIGDKLVTAFQNCGLDARRSHKAEGSIGWPVDKWTIYIDLGKTLICL